MFYQSGGCCEGSIPLCLEEGELLVGDNDVLLGQIGGCNFYMMKDQYEYWKHTRLIIDVSSGALDTFSLEGELGVHFVTRSRLFTDPEQKSLSEITFRV
jgi:uncharacterized protein (DUF779 family)